MFQALELSPGPATVEVRPAGIPAPFLLTTAVLAGPNLGEPEPHMHPEGMIMWPSRGSVVVLVEGAMRTLAVGQGIWVPPFTPHTMEVDASSTGCCTYFTPEVAPDWHSVGTVQLGAAFRELLLHLAESPMEVDQRLRAQTVVILAPNHPADRQRERQAGRDDHDEHGWNIDQHDESSPFPWQPRSNSAILSRHGPAIDAT